MRKPNYLQIKFISGRVQEDIWVRYEDIESIFHPGQELDESATSQKIADNYQKLNDLHIQINEVLLTLTKRIDYLNKL